MQTVAPLCFYCRHYFRDQENHGWEHCRAFPDKKGIPDRIYFDAYDHTKPFRGDKGIRFEEDPKNPVTSPYWLEVLGRDGQKNAES